MTQRMALALAALTIAWAAPAAPQASPPAQPRIGRPLPAPPGPSTLPRPPSAVIDETLTIGGDDLAARIREDRMMVEVAVNGTGPFRFLVDSGADTSVVSDSIARRLSLPARSPVVLQGMASRSLVARVGVEELQLGRSTFRNLTLPALREGDLGADGIVGIDALVDQRLMMDFDRKTIRVEDARRPVVEINGEIVVTARRRRGQLILTEVRTGGLRLDAVVDTGSQISVGNQALRQRLIRRGQKFETVEMTDVAGKKMPLEVALVRELRIGSIRLENVPVAFADLPPFEAFKLSEGPALLLGTDLLSAFRRISLDFRARKVRFQLRECRLTGFTVNTFGDGVSSRLSATGAGAC